VLRDREGKDRFVGPRFMIRVAGLEMNPLDAEDRIPELKSTIGSGMCNITRCCTEVCPEHINITDNGIIPLKERVVDRYYDPLLAVGRLLTGKKLRTVGQAGALRRRAGAQETHRTHQERHRSGRAGWLRAAVLGANDGIRLHGRAAGRGRCRGHGAAPGADQRHRGRWWQAPCPWLPGSTCRCARRRTRRQRTWPSSGASWPRTASASCRSWPASM
jgi:hypothetical protein